MNYTSTEFIVFYIFAIAGIVGNVFVMVTLLQCGLKSSSTRLVFHLNFSLVLQEIVSLPYIYSLNGTVCQMMGFFHIFSGLLNMLIVGTLVLVYRQVLVDGYVKVSTYNRKRIFTFLYGIPLILSLIPFISDEYGEVYNGWCSASGTGACLSDAGLGMNLFKAVGSYSVLSIICWIPRTIINIGDINHTEAEHRFVLERLLIYINGILCFMIFLSEKKSLILFESFTRNTPSIDEMNESPLFSWDGDIKDDMKDELIGPKSTSLVSRSSSIRESEQSQLSDA
eukprot:gene10309-13855_t